MGVADVVNQSQLISLISSHSTKETEGGVGESGCTGQKEILGNAEIFLIS